MVVLVQENNEILPRAGHCDVAEYTVAFLNFLYVRTGFRFERFTTPRHLQRILEDLSFNRVPMRVWQGVMAFALRIANMSKNMEHGARHFGAFFIDVVVFIMKRLVNMGLLRLSLFLIGWCVSPMITAAVSVLYYAISWLLDIIWEKFSEFIQSRMISAPYYKQFLTMA